MRRPSNLPARHAADRTGRPTASARRPVLRALAVLLSMLVPGLVPLPAVPGLFRAAPFVSAATEPPAAISDQASFEAWLTASGRSLASRYHAYRASYATYRDFGLLVYGTPGSVSGNAFDPASGQYRYLGWSYDEIRYTNTFYPPDAPVGDPQSTPWEWTGAWQEIALGTDAAVSWMRLAAREKEHVKASVLYYGGSSYGGMTFSALGLSEANAIVLSPPSWTLGFALYTKHYWGTGNLRYATFTGKGIGSVAVACALEETARPADGVYRIPADAGSVLVPVRATASVASCGGLARASDVAAIGVACGSAVASGSGAASRTAEGSFVVTRAMLGGAASAEVSLAGTAWAVSILGDRSFGTGVRTVTVADEAQPGTPFLSLSIVGSIGFFRGQTDLLGRAVALDPSRFLGLETVTVTATFRTPPDSVLFQPCTELLAADFDDPTGHRYRLGDFRRRSPAFPGEFTVPRAAVSALPGGGYAAVFRYQFPIVASTLTWEGKRLRPAYSLLVRATSSGKAWTRMLQGIEVTGDVFDVLHLQVAG